MRANCVAPGSIEAGALKRMNSFGMEEIKKYKPKPSYSFDGVNTVLSITRNIMLSKGDLKSSAT